MGIREAHRRYTRMIIEKIEKVTGRNLKKKKPGLKGNN